PPTRYCEPPDSSASFGLHVAVIGGISGVDPPGPEPVGGIWLSSVVTWTVVCSTASNEQTANAVVVTLKLLSGPMIPPIVVHEVGLAVPSVTGLPAASLGNCAIGLKLPTPGGVPSEPPPTTLAPAGHVTVTGAIDGRDAVAPFSCALETTTV